MSSQETYELYNFNHWVRVDIIRPILEYSGAKYECIFTVSTYYAPKQQLTCL